MNPLSCHLRYHDLVMVVTVTLLLFFTISQSHASNTSLKGKYKWAPIGKRSVLSTDMSSGPTLENMAVLCVPMAHIEDASNKKSERVYGIKTARALLRLSGRLGYQTLPRLNGVHRTRISRTRKLLCCPLEGKLTDCYSVIGSEEELYDTDANNSEESRWDR